ncbi:hypothetical protein BKA62DRAFT_826087 [Auriculariales sp. MPI-PUGE-AT-0066]|nr:hypothetical protein BKA62DRAFT_826087 [Auriculariales sp. MPI-PUGE-AT-0066]
MAFNRLPSGSRILVTGEFHSSCNCIILLTLCSLPGATGLAGSAITDLLLQRGFRVRGVGRSAAKAAPFADHLNTKYGAGAFEFAEVADYTISGAFDSVLQGVTGVVHVATEASFDVLSDVDTALVVSTAAVLGLMKAAAGIESVKSFVLTSSSVTVMATAIEYGKDVQLSTETWQDHAIALAQSLPSDIPAKGFMGYVASKIVGEREAWKFWNEEKPGYAFNSVLPDMILGPVLNPVKGTYTTHSWMNDVFLGNRDALSVAFMNPPEWMVDSRDTAIIHVAALLSTEMNGQRLWAAAHPHTLNQHLALWRKAFPDRNILPDFDFPAPPKIDLTDLDKSTKLLKEFAGKDWYTFEETSLANVAHAL